MGPSRGRLGCIISLGDPFRFFRYPKTIISGRSLFATSSPIFQHRSIENSWFLKHILYACHHSGSLSGRFCHFLRSQFVILKSPGPTPRLAVYPPVLSDSVKTAKKIPILRKKMGSVFCWDRRPPAGVKGRIQDYRISEKCLLDFQGNGKNFWKETKIGFCRF
jgi:hypothetical protein